VIYYLVSNSLKPASEFYASALAPPKSISFEALESALDEGGMLSALVNSVILASATLVVVVAIGAATAYAISVCGCRSRARSSSPFWCRCRSRL